MSQIRQRTPVGSLLWPRLCGKSIITGDVTRVVEHMRVHLQILRTGKFLQGKPLFSGSLHCDLGVEGETKCEERLSPISRIEVSQAVCEMLLMGPKKMLGRYSGAHM